MTDNLQPHIRCGIQDGAEYAILPGDPGRVDRIKMYLEDTREIAYNREFKTISGLYKNVRILVTSTGIGGPSTGIAVEELKNIGVRTMIRIGSCGALQKNIKLGSLVIPSGAVRNEGTSDTYIERGYPAVPDTDVLFSLISSAKKLGFTYHCGRVRSHDSFYTDNEDNIDAFWSEKGILAADMESASLYVIGGLRGIRTASVLNVVVEYGKDLESGINEYVEGERAASAGEGNEILAALEAIASLDKYLKGEL
jgi:uridine phosphorylase